MGRPADREQPYFDWAYICPSREDYREGLLEIIDDCAAENGDVRLDDIGFPRAEYCRCGVCEQRFAKSEYDDRLEWRAAVITDFLEEAVEHIPGRVYMTLYPDPYPGHLYERAGIDLEALEPFVDEFVVPLYDTAYETTYWLETIAKASRVPSRRRLVSNCTRSTSTSKICSTHSRWQTRTETMCSSATTPRTRGRRCVDAGLTTATASRSVSRVREQGAK